MKIKLLKITIFHVTIEFYFFLPLTSYIYSQNEKNVRISA